MTPVPIWVALGVGNRPSVTLLDATSGEDPQCWRGNDLEFHCAVFDAAGAVVNLNNAALVSANLYAAPDSSLAPLMPPVEVDSTDIEPVIEIDDWRARTDQQFTLAVPASSTMQEMTSRHVGKFWLAIKILTEDGEVITTGGGWLRIYDDGTQSGTVPPVPPSEYYTKTEIDALFATTVQDPTQDVGDFIVRGLDGLERREIGTEGQILAVQLGKPAWVTRTVSGDVTGPSGATADHFAAFSGATGKIIKDSGVGASSFETPAGADAKVAAHDGSSLAHADIRDLVGDVADYAAGVAGDLAAHESNTDNPHSVTKNQVGLGFAENTTDMQKPVSTAQALALAGKASLTDFNNHVGDHFNPHEVTKAQVGLGNADNTSDADKPISDATQDALDAVYISASNPANITQDSAHRFVSDTEKSTWNGKESGGAAAAAIVAHVGAADPHGDRADAASKYQPLSAGKGLSTNDYTTDEKSKLAGIAAGATANTASTANPLRAGTAAPGTAAPYAREDHVHPVDTSREPSIASGTGSQFWSGTKAWRDFATDVRASALTGYAIADSTIISATDTVIGALQKLDARIDEAAYQLQAGAAELAIPLSYTGTGAGVLTMRLFSDIAQTATIDGSGKFYTDAAGTLNEATSYAMMANAWTTFYIKVPSSTCTMRAPSGRAIRYFGNLSNSFIGETANGPKVNGLATTKIRQGVLAAYVLSSQNLSVITGTTYPWLNATQVYFYGNSLTISGTTYPWLSATQVYFYGNSLTVSGTTYPWLSATQVYFYGNSLTINADLSTSALYAGTGDFDLHINGTGVAASYPTTRAWPRNLSRVLITPAVGSMVSADVDRILIDIASTANLAAVGSKVINLGGNCGAHTSASDAAIATLTGLGFAVTVN